MQGVVMYLQQFNIGAAVAMRVQQTLGHSAVEMIKENPYVLSDMVDGVGFKTADEKMCIRDRNITVNGTVTVNNGGGVVGRMLIDGTITDCVNNADITASKANVGGIVGAAYYTAIGKEMTITGCENNGTITTTKGVAGGIVGLSAANVSNSKNTGAVTSSGGTSVGGIVGEQQNYGAVTGNTNSAAVNLSLIHILERAKTTNILRFNSRVVVQGCGPIGLICIAVLRTMGIENIVAVDGNEQRLEFAKRMGAGKTVNFMNHKGIEALSEACLLYTSCWSLLRLLLHPPPLLPRPPLLSPQQSRTSL